MPTPDFTTPPPDTLSDAADSPQSVPTEILERRVCELAAHLASGMCSFLLMVGELDRRCAWANWQAVSCAHWLSWRCGVGLTAAREQVRVGRALADLPLIRAEFAAGRLSYSKVRAVTRIATPELEQELVDLARSSTAAQTERWVRGYRRSERDDPVDDAPHPDPRPAPAKEPTTRTSTAAHPEARDTDSSGPDTSGPDTNDSGADQPRVGGSGAGGPGTSGPEASDSYADEHGSSGDDEDRPDAGQLGAAGAVGGRERQNDDGRYGGGTGLPRRPESELSWYTDDDGDIVLKVRLPAEEGRLLLAAVDAAKSQLTTPIIAEDDSAETPPPSRRDVSAAQALMYIAHAALATGPHDKSGSDRYQVVVHVDRDTLLGADGNADPSTGTDAGPGAGFSDEEPPGNAGGGHRPGVRGGRCEIRGGVAGDISNGSAVTVRTAWRIACDAMFRTMYHDSIGRPVAFSNERRFVTAAQRRLLLERDQGCAVPGCTHTRFLHAHHVRHWIMGGATDLDNLVMLCTAHHRAVHESQLGILAHGDQSFSFHTRDGRHLDSVPAATADALPVDRLAAPLHRPPAVDEDTIGGEWNGDRLDLHELVAGLRLRASRAAA